MKATVKRENDGGDRDTKSNCDDVDRDNGVTCYPGSESVKSVTVFITDFPVKEESLKHFNSFHHQSAISTPFERFPPFSIQFLFSVSATYSELQ